jgi:hypothetical protein
MNEDVPFEAIQSISGDVYGLMRIPFSAVEPKSRKNVETRIRLGVRVVSKDFRTPEGGKWAPDSCPCGHHRLTRVAL